MSNSRISRGERIMIFGSFADAVSLHMFGVRPVYEFGIEPPEGICGSTEEDDSKTNTRSGRLHCNRVDDQGHRRDYENNRSERISGYAIRASSIWKAFAVDENACCRECIKNPADKNHVGQELLIRSARGQHHGPQSRRTNGECRCAKSRMDSR